MNTQIENSIAPEASGAVTTKRRPLLFLAAYFIGVIIATGIITYQRLSGFPFEIDWSDEIGEISGGFLAIIVFLPCGLARMIEWILKVIGINFELIKSGPFPFPANALTKVLIGLSYLSCFILPIAGSVTSKQQTFRALYFVFVGLLVLNVGGCSLRL